MLKEVSILILTYNEEANLPGCLDSLEGINASIFVVDSFSTDATLQILDERKIRFIQHPFENYSAQRNWAQQANPYNTEWVFHLDAGERLTSELAAWLTSFDPSVQDVDGYMFSRKTMFFDQWIKYGGHYPNYHLRLFRVTKGRCEDKVYDQHFVLDGVAETIPAGIDIIDTVTDNLRDFTIGHAKWAVFEAMEAVQKMQKNKGEVQPNLRGNPIEKRRWLKNNVFMRAPLFWRSFLYFVYRYFFKLGFLDGRKGLIFHFLQGFWFRFLIDSMIVEITYKLSTGKTLEQVGLELGVDVKKLFKEFSELSTKNPSSTS
ncbi:MAG TPA: glycosyltransferase family 2 protein [Saprospiraceae bacterium]|nr:glycosyltransferase family 2 protein [Saprospiraceae bacterium]HMQ85774.1 glycosyltransferase family 2 protein [Saprospiraceae bacterium]